MLSAGSLHFTQLTQNLMHQPIVNVIVPEQKSFCHDTIRRPSLNDNSVDFELHLCYYGVTIAKEASLCVDCHPIKTIIGGKK